MRSTREKVVEMLVGAAGAAAHGRCELLIDRRCPARTQSTPPYRPPLTHWTASNAASCHSFRRLAARAIASGFRFLSARPRNRRLQPDARSPPTPPPPFQLPRASLILRLGCSSCTDRSTNIVLFHPASLRTLPDCHHACSTLVSRAVVGMAVLVDGGAGTAAVRWQRSSHAVRTSMDGRARVRYVAPS